MFQAMQAGVGSISTVHAMSATDTIERLADLAIKGVGGVGVRLPADRPPHRLHRPGRAGPHAQRQRPAPGHRDRRDHPGEEDRPIANTIFGLSRSRRQVLQAMPTPEMREILAEAGIDTDFFRGIEGTAA
jgi:hypothetical protein